MANKPFLNWSLMKQELHSSYSSQNAPDLKKQSASWTSMSTNKEIEIEYCLIVLQTQSWTTEPLSIHKDFETKMPISFKKRLICYAIRFKRKI